MVGRIVNFLSKKGFNCPQYLYVCYHLRPQIRETRRCFSYVFLLPRFGEDD